MRLTYDNNGKKVVLDDLELVGTIDENNGLFSIESVGGSPHTHLTDFQTEQDLKQACQILEIPIKILKVSPSGDVSTVIESLEMEQEL